MSMKYLNVLGQETLTPLEENEISLEVQEKLSNDKPLKDFLQQFLFPSVEPEVLKVQAELLHQLSGGIPNRVSFYHSGHSIWYSVFAINLKETKNAPMKSYKLENITPRFLI